MFNKFFIQPLASKFQEDNMITRVRCNTKDCPREDQILSTTAFLRSKLASLDGPFECPDCHKLMEIYDRVPENYKGGSGRKPGRHKVATPAAEKRRFVKKLPSKQPIHRKRVATKS
jgi:hypothetical protein